MRIRILFMVAVLALAGEGCIDETQRQIMINQRTEEKVASWVTENPATPFTPGQREFLRVQAVQEVDKAIEEGRSAGRSEAREKVLEAAGHAASGNYLAAGGALVMAALLFFGIKKAKTKPIGGDA